MSKKTKLPPKSESPKKWLKLNPLKETIFEAQPSPSVPNESVSELLAPDVVTLDDYKGRQNYTIKDLVKIHSNPTYSNMGQIEELESKVSALEELVARLIEHHPFKNDFINTYLIPYGYKRV